jgi:predicted nucleotidyltransferase
LTEVLSIFRFTPFEGKQYLGGKLRRRRCRSKTRFDPLLTNISDSHCNRWSDGKIEFYYKNYASSSETLPNEGVMMDSGTSKEKVAGLLRENYPYLVAEYGVKRIGLFGSYAKGTPSGRSDVDLVVEFAHPIGFRFIEFAEYLESLLGKKVDVLTPAGLQEIRIAHIAEEIEKSLVYV